MEYKGTLIKKSDAVRVTEKFVKREFVVSDKEDKYPQTIQFELTNERCKELDAVNEGDIININFSLRGREWKKPETGEVKYFNTLNAFKISLAQKGDGVPTPSSSTPPANGSGKEAVNEPVLVPEPDSDLPF